MIRRLEDLQTVFLLFDFRGRGAAAFERGRFGGKGGGSEMEVLLARAQLKEFFLLELWPRLLGILSCSFCCLVWMWLVLSCR